MKYWFIGCYRTGSGCTYVAKKESGTTARHQAQVVGNLAKVLTQDISDKVRDYKRLGF
jgi:hypothetical protein